MKTTSFAKPHGRTSTRTSIVCSLVDVLVFRGIAATSTFVVYITYFL